MAAIAVITMAYGLHWCLGVWEVQKHTDMIHKPDVTTVQSSEPIFSSWVTPRTEAFKRFLLTVIWSCKAGLLGHVGENLERRLYSG